MIHLSKSRASKGEKLLSYLELPELTLPADRKGTRNGEKIRCVVLHTTKGDPPVLLPGLGRNMDAAKRCLHTWVSREGGAHFVVDQDGTVSQLAPLMELTHHAPPCNHESVGIEIYQGADSSVYEGQLDAVVGLVDLLTADLGIQRQVPDQYRGALARFKVGPSFYGVIGHRDVTSNRGAGDPGSQIFEKLKWAGYEPFDLSTAADVRTWTLRQRGFGLKEDGIPGASTVNALRSSKPDGLWVSRDLSGYILESEPTKG